jgi:hypothetical protein
MGGFLVLSRGLRRSVNLYQNESCLVIYLLYDIKASNSRLSDALRSILNRRLAKGLHTLGFDMHMDVDDKQSEHAVL